MIELMVHEIYPYTVVYVRGPWNPMLKAVLKAVWGWEFLTKTLPYGWSPTFRAWGIPAEDYWMLDQCFNTAYGRRCWTAEWVDQMSKHEEPAEDKDISLEDLNEVQKELGKAALL